MRDCIFLDVVICLLFLSDKFIWILCWLFFWRYYCLGNSGLFDSAPPLRHDALAENIMHIFSFFWWFQATYLRAWQAGCLASFYMVLKWIWTLFFGWSRNDQFISRWFFAQLMNYQSFMRLLQPACFALVILLVITMIHSWSNLRDQEWWKKSAKIRLIWLHGILISFLLKSFGECYVSFWGYFVCNDNFTVGSVMDMVMVFVLLLRQILLCNDNFIVGFCIMDFEGHLLKVNKIYTIFFFGKK